jgi:hypothetical protein
MAVSRTAKFHAAAGKAKAKKKLAASQRNLERARMAQAENGQFPSV